VHAIEIEVDAAGVEALLAQPKVYTSGSVTIDGAVLADVGVRLKGSAGSFVALDGDYPEISGDGNGKPGKSAFIVDFNRYVGGQSYLGLEKLTINNMVQDPSCIHEFVGYALFRAGDVPASRAGFATVAFNGEDKGLYSLIETPDNDEFLDKWFGADDGNLYEGAYGADFRDPGDPPPGDEDWEWWFDQDNGDDIDFADLYELIAALDAIGDDEDAADVLEDHFDLDEYLTFAATELYLGHWDGYAWSANNYTVHHSFVDDQWTFLPWGIDQLFEDELLPFAGVMRAPGPSWGEGEAGGGGRIHQLCFTSASCRARLATAFEELIARVDELELAALADDAREVVEDRALAESTAYGDPERTTESLDRVGQFIDDRAAQIEAWLPCLDGEVIDNDEDTHDGCSVDCDDGNPDVHPGADEACDLLDNDCNGVIDDPVECPKCVPRTGPGDVEYLFCFERSGWDAARTHCLDEGGELASIHDPASFEFVTFGLLEIGIPSETLWIGLNDQATEGEFVWTDGSALDFPNWSSGSPADGPEGAERDCVVTAPWGWWDMPCAEEQPFACRFP
jgi:hypothetical protein